MKKSYSILYPDFEGVEYKRLSEITCHDLALDMLSRHLSDNPKESKLILDTISNMTANPKVAEYRQKVFCDILRFPSLRERMSELFERFSFIRDFGVFNRSDDEKKGIWHLLRRMDELGDYVACVEAMEECLTENPVESEGLKGFKEYIHSLYNNACFGELKKDISTLKEQTSEVRSVTVGINVNERFEATGLGLISINNKSFKKSGIVGNFADAISAKQRIQEGTEWNGDMHYHPIDIVRTGNDNMTKFLSQGIKNSLGSMKILAGQKNEHRETVANVTGGDGMANATYYLSEVVNKMLDMILRKLRDTLKKYSDIAVVNISRVIPEFVFYIRFAEFIENKMAEGFTFCEPCVLHAPGKQMETTGFYNLKLANAGKKREEIVTNDLVFDKEHTVYILTGANRGGKTTVTQAVGILYVLAQGGISVPASTFSYKPLDCIYTHFPADEDKTLDLGRLGEECIRFKEGYTNCTENSLYLLNETFSTTSFEEGYYIAKDSVRALLKKSVRTIYNTHMHKLAEAVDELNLETSEAGAASLIVRSEEGTRSFKLELAPPEGKSHARDIAEKYGVTYEMLTDGV